MIINFILFIALALFVYSIGFLTTRKIANKIFDNKLNITTTGTRAWKGSKSKLYHRAESTPYLALNKLTNHYQVNSDDQLVDFGSGKGRAAIFLHYKLNIKTTGIELNEITIKEANENKASYLEETKDIYENRAGLSFVNDYADKYILEEKDNVFFFFNPFDVEIFGKVLSNIIANAEYYNKKVDVILYYPTKEYRNHIRKDGELKLNKIIFSLGSITLLERFVIYTYTPKGARDINANYDSQLIT